MDGEGGGDMSWTKELESGGSVGVASGPRDPRTAKVSLARGTDFLEVELTEAEAAAFVTELAARFGKRYEKVIVPALEVARRYGGTDEGHHKAWVIDQMVRALTGKDYEKWVRERKDGVAGLNTYSWDEGIAP